MNRAKEFVYALNDYITNRDLDSILYSVLFEINGGNTTLQEVWDYLQEMDDKEFDPGLGEKDE